MKVIRLFLSVVLLLIVVAGLALAALYYFIDPNKLKPAIIAKVKNETGYTLSIDGNLNWTLYPRLAIYVPNMTLTESGHSKPFADLQNIKMAADTMQLLRGQGKLQGNIRIASLTLMDLHFSNVETVLYWQDNVLNLNPIKAALYQGTLSGTATGHSFSNVPHWDWNVLLSQVELKSLLADLNPESKLVVSGVGDVQMQASTAGKSRAQMISNLGGNITFQLTNGAVYGIDLNYLVTTADAIINKQPMPAPQDLFRTEFSALTGSAVISHGIATLSGVQLTSPTFITKGEGDIGLMSNSLDIKLLTTSQEQLKTQWNIPILVQGSLSHPDVKLDNDQLTKYVLKDKIDKVKDKAREAIQKHVPGEAGEFLQKLLSR